MRNDLARVQLISRTFLLLLACFSFSCGESEEPLSKPPKIENDGIIKRVYETKDIFEIYEIMKDFDSKGTRQNYSSDVKKAITKRYNEMLMRLKPKYDICEEANLYAFGYRKIIENRYRIYFLFKTNKELSEDWRIYIHGHVDDSHIKHLPPARRKSKYAP